MARTGPARTRPNYSVGRSEEHTSELQSRSDLVCRLLLEKKKSTRNADIFRHSAHSFPRSSDISLTDPSSPGPEIPPFSRWFRRLTRSRLSLWRPNADRGC